jgi:hypothetical protein
MVSVTTAATGDKSAYTIDFTAQLMGIDGKLLAGDDCIAERNTPMPVPGKTCSVLTLSMAAVDALISSQIDQEEKTSPDKKFSTGSSPAKATTTRPQRCHWRT